MVSAVSVLRTTLLIRCDLQISALTFAKDSDAAAFEASRAETEALSADLRAQIANLESAASDAAARVEELGASAEAAAQQAQAEMDSLRAQMMHAKDEALNMLEDNFGDEIKRKEEEIAAEWAEIMQRKLEEQSHEHKQETKQRESVHLEQLREARETAAKASWMLAWLRVLRPHRSSVDSEPRHRDVRREGAPLRRRPARRPNRP